MMAKDMIAAHECAELLGVSLPTFWRRVADGTVPRAIKIGGLSRWMRTDITDVIERAKAARHAPRFSDGDLEIASAIVKRYEHRFFKASGNGAKTAELALEFACDVLQHARREWLGDQAEPVSLVDQLLNSFDRHDAAEGK